MAQSAGINFAQVEPIGVGMALNGQNPAHGHSCKTRGQPLDIFNLEAGDTQTMADLVDIGLDPDEFP